MSLYGEALTYVNNGNFSFLFCFCSSVDSISALDASWSGYPVLYLWPCLVLKSAIRSSVCREFGAMHSQSSSLSSLSFYHWLYFQLQHSFFFAARLGCCDKSVQNLKVCRVSRTQCKKPHTPLIFLHIESS